MVVQDLSDARYRRVMSVNLDGVVFGVRACVPAISARGGGAIVATSSLAGIGPLPQDPVYAATKHAVIGLVRSLAGPLTGHHITINAICPGGIDTPLLDSTGSRETMLEAGRPLMDPDVCAQVVSDLMVGHRDRPGLRRPLRTRRRALRVPGCAGPAGRLTVALPPDPRTTYDASDPARTLPAPGSTRSSAR